MSVPASPGRPTVAEVAQLLRARTKDSSGVEVGTFDDETRPTGDQVEDHITTAMALVGTRFPPTLADEFIPASRALVAYRAALRIEKAYFPEQVRSDRSAYAQLKTEYDEDLQALLDAIEAGGLGQQDAPTSGITNLIIGSWTSIPPPGVVWP